MTTYTPGPWLIDPESPASGAAEDQGDIITTGNGLRTIAEVHHHVGHEDETRANARLIAAAPGLLAALEIIAADGCRMQENDAPCGDCDGCTAQAAIAKATEATA
jgi:hypothetical protein